MRRFLRKPRELKVRELTARLVQINEDLSLYPPSFSPKQQLDDDELADIIEFSLPYAWQKVMMVQGFDILEHSLDDLTDFAERLEAAESIYDAHMKSNEPRAKPDVKRGSEKRTYGPSKSPDGDSKSRFQNGKRKERECWCPYHRTNKHDLRECKVVLGQVEKMRATWDSKPPAKRPKYEARTGTKRVEPSEHEMYEFCSNFVKKQRRANKKDSGHKGPSKVTPEDSDSSVEESLHAFDHLKIDESDDGWDSIDDVDELFGEKEFAT
jgi:hypothetical protein